MFSHFDKILGFEVYIMKDKSSAATRWIIFSVLSVILPVIFAVIIAKIMTANTLQLTEITESIILVAFSISCSLLSVCFDTHKNKHSKCTYICFWIAGVFMFASWSFYIFYLTYNFKHIYIVCIISLIVVVICSILGIKLGNQNDEYKKNVINSMHKNCAFIRKKLVKKNENDVLKTHTLRADDLLCNPKNFDRIKESIQYILNRRQQNQ